jgi:hypothetical protein
VSPTRKGVWVEGRASHEGRASSPLRSVVWLGQHSRGVSSSGRLKSLLIEWRRRLPSGCRRLLASTHTGPKWPFCSSRHRLRGNAFYQQASAVCSRAGRARPGNGRARAQVLTQMAVTKAKPPFFGLVQSSTSNNQLPNTQRPRINVGSASTSSPHKSRRAECRRCRSS